MPPAQSRAQQQHTANIIAGPKTDNCNNEAIIAVLLLVGVAAAAAAAASRH